MKIGKENIPGLVMKELKSGAGGFYFGWEPSPTQRKAGWKTLKLDGPLETAIRQARAQNDKIAEWRSGGARPRAVASYKKHDTFGALIARYRREKLSRLAKSTQRVANASLDRLDTWAGDKPVAWITRKRVKALRLGMCPDGEGSPSHSITFKTLKQGREIFSWWIDEDDIAMTNPFERFGLAEPNAREQVWEEADFVAFHTAAAALDQEADNGDPDALEAAFAVEIAAWVGQREADIIRYSEKNWVDMTLQTDPLHVAMLDNGTGRVMGLQVRQAKTNRWNGVQISGDLRTKIETRIAANRRRDPAVPTILFCHATGRPFSERHFIRTFDRVRAKAVEMGHTAMGELQYRDLRRTCVVRLGRLNLNDGQISAITGHKLETTKRILETYMPRDGHMAGSAIVARIGPTGRQPEQKEKQG